jgi:hypothetical protein
MEIDRLRAIEAAASEAVRAREAALNGVSLGLADHRREKLHELHADAMEAIRSALALGEK